MLHKAIIILNFLLFFTFCHNKSLSFYLEVNRDFEQAITKENAFDHIEDIKNNISLKCDVRICQIYENKKLVKEKEINENEIKIISSLIKELKKKTKEFNENKYIC